MAKTLKQRLRKLTPLAALDAALEVEGGGLSQDVELSLLRILQIWIEVLLFYNCGFAGNL